MNLPTHLRILAAGIFLLSLNPPQSIAQTEQPESQLRVAEVAAHMNFLAADELRGRRTGSEGIMIAAKYIASQYAGLGLDFAPGMDTWYQDVPYVEVTPPETGSLSYGEEMLEHGDNMLFLSAPELDLNKQKYVFAGYGAKTDEQNDYEDLDVDGKVVITYLGLPGEEDPGAVLGSVSDKRKWAKEEGAVGLIELYRLRFPWGFAKRYFGSPRISLDESAEDENPDFFYGWIEDGQGSVGEYFLGNAEGKMNLVCSGSDKRTFSSPNVIGYLEGSDPERKDEVIVVSAHYDHVGVGEQGGGRYTEEDSIFNGARDNAFGTVAVLSAAKSFSQNPPARSILFIALSGEEIGLLGSKYYADHPVYPLQQTVFNVNTDGAGYAVTDAVSVIGYGRTSIDNQIDAGAQAFGMNVIANPAPEQGLFDRSDNVSFAKKGIPAVNVAPGLQSFNRQISKYYHQVADNPETVDMDYLLVYCQTVTHIARLIADVPTAPVWMEGDKYEPAFKALYGE